jgi:hypothetical protein
MKFLADDGHFLIKNQPSRFANYFDWIMTEHTTLKQKDIPKTIFVKTDYLPRFVNQNLLYITNNFKLITGSSDWSPVINFRKEYDAILSNPYLIHWYMTNSLQSHPKITAYPGGLCHNETSDKLLLDVRNNIKKQDSNKILCVWRTRNFNVCGNQYITRDIVKSFIKQNNETFDWYVPNLSTENFYKLMSQYKFVLCPVGNGVDPCPKAFEAIILKTIPIMIKTQNTCDVYTDLPVLLVDDFSEVLNMNLSEIYESKKYLFDDKYLFKLTCEYWVEKISNSS